MHATMTRLYQAAAQLTAATGQSSLAALMNHSPQTLNNWESRGMSQKGMLEAERMMGCSAVWLKTGEGPMIVSAQLRDLPGARQAPPSPDRNVGRAVIGEKRLPVISYVQAGKMTEMRDPFSTGDVFDFLLTDLDLPESAFCLIIRGESMSPEFHEGDRIVIDPELAPRPGDFVVAKNGSQDATFKKYRPRGVSLTGQEVFELTPLNDDYPTLRSDTEPLQIIGVMVEHRRYRKK
ncbi:MAG: LexA family protein [Janthinobacterium lividum]